MGAAFLIGFIWAIRNIAIKEIDQEKCVGGGVFCSLDDAIALGDDGLFHRVPVMFMQNPLRIGLP